jgi:hypothetical protein
MTVIKAAVRTLVALFVAFFGTLQLSMTGCALAPDAAWTRWVCHTHRIASPIFVFAVLLALTLLALSRRFLAWRVPLAVVLLLSYGVYGISDAVNYRLWWLALVPVIALAAAAGVGLRNSGESPIHGANLTNATGFARRPTPKSILGPNLWWIAMPPVSNLTQSLEIFCDEAGSTGPALLDPKQRYFAYSSVALAESEAVELIRDARTRFPVQMPELKSAKLLKTRQGRQLIRHLLAGVANRYAVAVHDKVLALCGQFYEYVFEPVFQDSPWFLYEKKLQQFVAMVLYTWFVSQERDALAVLSQFQDYMRSGDPEHAPLLFGRIALSEPPISDPLNSIIRFARAARDSIVSDNATLSEELPAEGLWVLDLATTSAFAHLNHWGSKHCPLAVTCDDSKPLLANIPEFSGDENDPGIRRAQMKNYSGPLGWRLARPIEFANSRASAALQLADVIAGVATYAIRRDIPKDPDVEFFRAALQPHTLAACILPDFSAVNPNCKAAAVHAAILYRLADQVERGRDPLTTVESDYAFAEAAWDAGYFRRG